MGTPSKPLPVKLVIGLIVNDITLLPEIQRTLEKRFGTIDLASETLAFDQTRYYEEEMGPRLSRRFVGFKRLIRGEELAKIKHWTNAMEQRYWRAKRKRRVNIDPGYVSLPKFVLATTKNHGHRIYVGRCLFAEVTLLFCDQTFKALPWTYPDYRTDSSISFFNALRESYKQEIEKTYGRSQLHRSL